MHLTRFDLLTSGLLLGPGLVSAGTHSRRGVDCYFETPAASGDTCESLAFSWGIPVDLFATLNPGVACPNLEAGKSYCVVGEHIRDVTPTTSTASQPQGTTTSASTTTQTSTSSGSTTTSATPSIYPTMPGIAPNCDRFYKVKSGDTCESVASSNGITIDQLRAWNTEINADCTNLWLDYYICTQVPGAELPSTTSAAPSPTHSPTLPGAVLNCDKLYKIVSGDTCENVCAKNAITVDQFRSWNTQINPGMSHPPGFLLDSSVTDHRS